MSSDLVGFNRIPCPGGSDTAVATPFHQTPVFAGRLESVPPVDGSTVVVTPAGSPALVPDAFTDIPHYLRFKGDSALAGAWYDVTANDDATITIEVGDGAPGSLAANDAFDVVPHWTLASLLPPDTQTTVHASSGFLPGDRQSRILLADITSEGIRLAPDRIYFLTDEGWFQAAGGFPPSDDLVIEPGQVLIVRHPEGAADTVFYTINQVHRHDHRTPIRTRTDGPQDNYLGLMRPVPVLLSDLDLDATVFADSASNEDRADELLVYDNLTAVLNKEPATTYFRVGGEWREDDGDAYPVSGGESILPSTALVIRKAPTASGETLVWVNSPRY